jgi:peptide/nickel transport system substrate-binding protein/oligopeptide transport system substrate-binding protein
LVAAGTLALLLSACGGSSTSNQPTQPTGPAKGANQKLIMYLGTGGGSQDIVTLDPGVGQDSASLSVINEIFDGLVTLDKNLNVEKWGADNITVSSDGLTYTFHLRAGQKFVDGTPVKASDYAFSINRSDNPCLASPVNSYLAAIKDAAAFAAETCGADGKTITGSIQSLIGDSVVADDSAGTLALTLAQPAGYFEEALTYSTSFAVEQSALGDGLGANGKWLDNLAKGMGSSGMFAVKTWDHAGNLDLVANPNWWGKKPNFSEVDFKLFESVDTEYSTFQSDPTAGANNEQEIPVGQVAAAKSDSDFKSAPLLTFSGFEMNYKIKPFDNKDARLAFCEAIDRTAIVHNILKDTASPTWNIVPKGMPGYNPNLQGPDGAPVSGDLAKAQAHWAAYKATLNGAQIPPIKLSFNLARASQKATAEYYQATWNAAFGLNTTIDQTAWPTILKEQDQKTVQLSRFAWGADYPDPQDFMTLLFDTHSAYNNWNVSVPAADQLMEAADKIYQPDQQNTRMSDYNQAEQLLINDGGMCITYQPTNFYKVRPWVYGFEQDAQAFYPLDDWQNGYLTAAEPAA